MKVLTAWLALALCTIAPALAAQPSAVELRVLDAQGAWLNPATTRASIARSLPPELGALGGPDDALRFVVVATRDLAAEPVGAVTLDARGAPLDALVNLPTEPMACPDGVAPDRVCRATQPLRLVTDGLDRSHPAVSARSLRAELGGVLHLSLGSQTRLELPIGAPRELGPTARYRARLRVLVLRSRRGGMPALGGSDVDARRLVQQELQSASAIWSQCGVDWGLGTTSTIDVVDPPPALLINLGCGVGLPASGGELRVAWGARRVVLGTHPGESPLAATQRLAEALRDGGKLPRVFENQRTADDAVPSAEILLSGRAAERALTASSSDPTLPVCVGRLDLNDGLTHFSDGDAFAGTLEERVLLRALDDHDAASVEVLVIPSFERGERIGESFIVSPGSSLPNALIVDRSAIAAGARSFALAHELGHVLLAMPGHPDDFGVDQSWSLMDSDVADASIFGPRRLSLADCRRALTQTGPNSLVPILAPFPPN